MSKYSFTACVSFFILSVSSCSKPEEPVNNPPADYKIKVISGNGQTDTIGHTLKDSLVFEITKGVDTIKKGYLRLETYNCDNIVSSNEYDLSVFSYMGVPLKLSYPWRLNGISGTQNFKATFLDSLKIPRDSVTVSATALPPATGWHPSGCFPLYNFAVSFCELPSGRILAALYKKGYLLYSDDEGITWHQFTSFPDTYKITKLISTPANEIFLSVNETGMFYSSDGGMHWKARNTGLPADGFWGDIQYTNSHQLFVLTLHGIYTSRDKGINWHQVTDGLSYYAGFSCASTTSDSTVFAIHNNRLVQSTDGGEGWREVYTLSVISGVSWLYVDDNDDIYISEGSASPYSLKVSRDHAQTWTKVFDPVLSSTSTNSIITRMMKKNGNYYFYSTDENVLIKTPDFVSYQTVPMPIGSNNGRLSFSYFITAGDHKIISTEFQGLYYFLP